LSYLIKTILESPILAAIKKFGVNINDDKVVPEKCVTILVAFNSYTVLCIPLNKLFINIY